MTTHPDTPDLLRQAAKMIEVRMDTANTDLWTPSQVLALVAFALRHADGETEAAPTAPETPVAWRADVADSTNAMLCDFATRWKVDGDYLRCRVCNRPQLASCADSQFPHSSQCLRHGSGEQDGFEPRPWLDFIRILAPLYAAAPPSPPLPESVREAVEMLDYARARTTTDSVVILTKHYDTLRAWIKKVTP